MRDLKPIRPYHHLIMEMQDSGISYYVYHPSGSEHILSEEYARVHRRAKGFMPRVIEGGTAPLNFLVLKKCTH